MGADLSSPVRRIADTRDRVSILSSPSKPKSRFVVGGALTATATSTATSTATATGSRSRSGSRGLSKDKSKSKGAKSREDERIDSRDDPRFATPQKLVTVNGIRKVSLAIPEDSKRFAFENDLKGGAPMCWRIASQTASQFVASGLRDASSIFTKSTEIHIYFPAFTRYFAVRSFQSKSGFTLAHIMRCIETTSLGAMAFYIKNDLSINLAPGRKPVRVTSALVKKLLRLYAMCAINIKGNRVYCITADV